MRITARANRPAPDPKKKSDPLAQSIPEKGLKQITETIQSSPLNEHLKDFNANRAHGVATNYPYNEELRNIGPSPKSVGGAGSQTVHSALETVTEKISSARPRNQRIDESLSNILDPRPTVRSVTINKPFENKGALFLFQGAEGPGTDSPFISLFFQRFPTSIDYSVNSNIAEQNIAGQTGTSLQNLGSTSRKISMEVLFHDAFLHSEQISTHRALAVLDNMIRNGWKYKLFLRIGASPRMTCVLLNSIKVSMEHFAGNQPNHAFTPPNQTKLQETKQSLHVKIRRGSDFREPNLPQKAVAQLEFIEDLSKDVVVAFKKRSPKRAKPPAKPKEQLVCMTADEYNTMQQSLVPVADERFPVNQSNPDITESTTIGDRTGVSP